MPQKGCKSPLWPSFRPLLFLYKLFIATAISLPTLLRAISQPGEATLASSQPDLWDLLVAPGETPAPSDALPGPSPSGPHLPQHRPQLLSPHTSLTLCLLLTQSLPPVCDPVLAVVQGLWCGLPSLSGTFLLVCFADSTHPLRCCSKSLSLKPF